MNLKCDPSLRFKNVLQQETTTNTSKSKKSALQKLSFGKKYVHCWTTRNDEK